MTSLTRGPAALVTAVVVLAGTLVSGCSSEPEIPPYSPVTTPTPSDPDQLAEKRERRRAGARLMDGEGYWYVAPEGWHDASRKFRRTQERVDTAVQVDGAASDDYATSVTVWTAPAGGQLNAPLRRLGRIFAQHLTWFASGIETVPGRHRLDGEPAVLLHGQSRFGRRPATLDQYVVSWGRRVYLVTFALETATSAAERESLVRRVFRSWHWD